ncbi:hypothetical protein KDL44_09700 [bacterium]|nr:hypothetical protein [bacterium]
MAFHCEQLRPPAELTGSYTDGQLLYLTRNRFLRISLVAFAAYLLPVLLLANLPYLKGIANQSDPSALLMDLLPLLDMLVIGLLPAFISCAVNLHLPRFSISLRIMLVLLLLVGSVALGMLPYRYFLDRILNQSDPDQINRLMLQMTLAYTLLHCAALLLAALLALILPKRLARA